MASPSEATPNTSSIYIVGENETWTSGAYKNVIDSLQERSNKREWLHKTNIYDLFIWFIIIPLSFFSIYKIEHFSFFDNQGVSSVFIVALYLYFFIIVLNLFRMLFNYARWVFPKMELITSFKKGAILHRIILGAISLAIFSSFIYDLVRLTIKLLLHK